MLVDDKSLRRIFARMNVDSFELSTHNKTAELEPISWVGWINTEVPDSINDEKGFNSSKTEIKPGDFGS